MANPQLIDIGISTPRGEGDNAEIWMAMGLMVDVLGDLKPIFDKAIHPLLLDHMRKVFDSQGSYGGVHWADYSNEPKYRAYKKSIVGHLDRLRWQKGGPYEILYPSLTNPSHMTHVWVARAHGFVFGTMLDYARRLSEGGIGPFGEPYPGREVLPFKQKQIADYLREIQREIDRAWDIGSARYNA